jgi:hypothetical protein
VQLLHVRVALRPAPGLGGVLKDRRQVAAGAGGKAKATA